jgi:hypothetical protein
MKQIPSLETDSRSVIQEIPCLLWNSKAYYIVHRSLQLDPILGHFSPHLTFHILKTYFNIIIICNLWYKYPYSV